MTLLAESPTPKSLDDPSVAPVAQTNRYALSPVEQDLNTKMVLYAQVGVSEYWVLDVNGRALWIHADPAPTGYATIQEYDDTASVLPLTAPSGSAPITVASLLP